MVEDRKPYVEITPDKLSKLRIRRIADRKKPTPKPEAEPAPQKLRKLKRPERGKPVEDKDVLVIEQVADMLHCSVQSARNIPEDELPRHHGPGKRLLYMREDVLRYVRGQKRANPAADDLMRDVEAGLLDFPVDSGPRHCERTMQ